MYAQLIDTNGGKREVKPANGRDFTPAEAQALVGGYVQLVVLNDGKIMLIDEEAKLKPHEINPTATYLAHHVWAIAVSDYIAGNALVTITITCAVFAAATMAGCATKPRATLRPLDHFEADRIKLQVASMDAAVAGIVFHPIANR